MVRSGLLEILVLFPRPERNEHLNSKKTDKFLRLENLLLDKELGIFYKTLLRVLHFSRMWRIFNENNECQI
jgi:hypothetical protein